MRNQKRTLYILLAILAVLILLILFVIPNLGRPEPIQTVENRISLCPLDRADIRQITYATANNTRTLISTEDGWIYEDGTPESQDTVSNMLAAVTGLYSTQLAYQGREHFPDCGLDSPALVIHISGPTASATLTIGNYNNALDRWYCTVDDGTDIYLIGNNLPTRFGITR